MYQLKTTIKAVEVSLQGLLVEEALRLMGEVRPSRNSTPTGTGALQIVPDLDEPGVFLVYNYIDT